MNHIPINIRPVRTLEDIRANTVTLDGHKVIMYCGPDAASAESFGKLKPIDWSIGRVSQVITNREFDWDFGITFPKAIKMMREGWPEGTAQMRELAKTIRATLPKAHKTMVHYKPSIAPIGGLTLNIHDIATGGPQPFIGRFKTLQETEQRGKRIIRIGINASYSSGVSAETAMARGAAISALIHVLEENKITTDVVCINTKEDALFIRHVKPAGYPINEDQLTFALAHPAAHRRLSFGMVEHCPQTCQGFHRFTKDYGLTVSLKRYWPEYASQFDTVVDSSNTCEDQVNWTSPVAATAWVKTQLQAQGIQVQ